MSTNQVEALIIKRAENEAHKRRNSYRTQVTDPIGGLSNHASHAKVVEKLRERTPDSQLSTDDVRDVIDAMSACVYDRVFLKQKQAELNNVCNMLAFMQRELQEDE